MSQEVIAISLSSHKQISFAILRLLQNRTDRDHRLLQEDILRILEEETGRAHTRKAIRSNLQELQDAGFPICCSAGWYYEHQFTEQELHLLIDGLQSINGITKLQRDELQQKVCMLGGVHFQPQDVEKALKPENDLFLHNLNVLHDAIGSGVMVSFFYGDYGTDKELHPRKNRRGNPKEYIVSPYHLVSVNGKYYLIAKSQNHEGLAHFRVDHLLSVRRMYKRVTPLAEAYPGEFNLPEYVAQHPYMYAGKAETFRLRIKRPEGVGNVLDWFGLDVSLNEHDGAVEAVVVSDRTSMDFWLRRYSSYSEVIREGSPDDFFPPVIDSDHPL